MDRLHWPLATISKMSAQRPPLCAALCAWHTLSCAPLAPHCPRLLWLCNRAHLPRACSHQALLGTGRSKQKGGSGGAGESACCARVRPPSLGPQHLDKSRVCIQGWGRGGDRLIPSAPWPARLAKSARSSAKRACLTK